MKRNGDATAKIIFMWTILFIGTGAIAFIKKSGAGPAAGRGRVTTQRYDDGRVMCFSIEARVER